jgi:phage baseplate assembly protein W
MNYQNTDKWAVDLSKNLKTEGEIYNEDAIYQSVESLILTVFGERIFNTAIGSEAYKLIFRNLHSINGEKALDDIIRSIRIWEPNVTVLEDEAKFIKDIGQHAIFVYIPYVVNYSNVRTHYLTKLKA